MYRLSATARRCVEVLVSLLLIGSVGAAQPTVAEARFIDYLYIEANEGGSSGGHVALRFDSETFHFQQEGDGLIRMRRDDADAFHFRYAMLGNRPIHETRIAVSDDTYGLLRGTFARRLLVQTAQYARLAALEDDVALFAQWPRPGSASPAVAVPVRAAGYFLADGFPHSGPAGERSPALAALRAAVAAARGDAFVARRLAAIRAGLAAWRPRAQRAAAPPLAPDEYPGFAPAASTVYAEQLEALTALEVLDAAPALRPDTYRVADQAPALSADERRALAGFARDLRADLAALAASPRADFGYPLLLGMARLAALEASLARGRLVVLDALADSAPTATVPAQRAAYLDAVVARLRPVVDRSRRELFLQDHFREADYTQLETTVNRLLEVEHARRDGAPLRMERGLLMPARPAARGEPIAPPLPEATARAELDAARAAALQYRARLAELYGYHLITRNCVSEVFATVDAALADGADSDGSAASRRRLGGAVRIRHNLNFIPFVSAGAVERSYATVARRTRPSYRQLRLAALQTDEPGWRVALRESNTLTSTAYHPGPRDSAFLFFTDDAGALRPLLGAANLLVGVVDGTLGLVTWPADAGARLRAGWSGALFSLPELAFFNIRKGSMAYIDADVVADRGWSSVVSRRWQVVATTITDD